MVESVAPLINKIARTLTRSWLETELGQEFGIDGRGFKPSLQIALSPHRPFPNASLKWNRLSRGTTNPLEIEKATMQYLAAALPGWGNNSSPNDDYTKGSTLARGFDTPFKTVYFDDLSGTPEHPTAGEAFTDDAPGTRDIEGWIFLSKTGSISPGSMINFQDSKRQCVGEAITERLVAGGFRVSVVPYEWWMRQHTLRQLLP